MSARLVLFGRAPVPGAVKTRLAAGIGPTAAAEVYRVLLEHTLAAAVASGLPTILLLAEKPPEELDWRPPNTVEVGLQVHGDLGERMAHAFARQLAAAEVVVLAGSDVPGITAALLRHAAELCRRSQVVLGPASDGGYWLVAQRRPGVDLFAGVPWSSPRTLAATRALLERLGVSHVELPVMRDLDTTEELEAALAAPRLDPRLKARLAAARRSE